MYDLTRKGVRMDYQKIVYAIDDGVAVITMKHEANLNALDMQMGAELLDAIGNVEANDEVKVLVIKGLPRAFSAGGDVAMLHGVLKSGKSVDMDAMMEKNSIIADKLKRMGKLVITAVSGSAAGAGVSLALSGDFVICADNAKFILAFVNLGLVPDMGLTYLLSKAIGPARTMELAVTGRPVKAAEMAEWGLVHRMVSAEELDAATMEFARKLAVGPLVAYRNIKKQVYEANYADYARWIAEVEVPTQCECADTADFREGVYAFIEKRTAEFRGE